MSETLSAAAQALGIPESLVRRSAEARAAETGSDVEEILAAWAGGGAPTQRVTDEPTGEREDAEEATEEDVEETPPQAEEPAAAPAPPPVEIPAPAAAATPPAPPPVPTQVSEVEAAKVPVVITVPTSNLKERTSLTMPSWLTAVLIGIPLFALFTLGGSATGTCGDGTELATDVVSGEIVNCDGTEFTGSAIGGGQNFVALGERIYSGGEVAGVNCAGCHAPSGQGLAPFPALTGALNTFGSCADHIEWVSLGTDGFLNAGRSTYGDTAKPLGAAGKMPGFAASLSPEQIAAVSAFERVRFGGADPEAILVDCGLAEEPPGEGADGAGGDGAGDQESEESGTEGGEEAPTTTTP